MAFAAALPVLIGTSGTARAFSKSSLTGTYACKLDGSFIRQPFSAITVTFTADGKGNIDGLGSVSTALAAKSGSMDAIMTAFGTGQTPGPGSAALYFGELVAETCNFLVHDGTYFVGGQGRGTMTINWTARSTNSPSPVDCSKDINSASYQFLMTSTSALYLDQTDAVTGSCTGAGINYNNCGAVMSGSCIKQAGGAFPKTVPTP
jgi:hypothetical protein